MSDFSVDCKYPALKEDKVYNEKTIWFCGGRLVQISHNNLIKVALDEGSG